MAKRPDLWPFDLDHAELTVSDAEGFTIYEFVNPVLIDDALLQMRGAARGNGIDAATVTFDGFHGGVIGYEARMIFVTVPEIGRKIVAGKQPGNVVGTEREARESLNATAARVCADAKVHAYTIAQLKGRKNLGFMEDGFTLLLEEAGATCVVQEVCSLCNGKASTPCSVCHEKGALPCLRCHGRTEVTCPACKGAHTVLQNGQRVPCKACRQRGRVRCTACGGKGEKVCVACKGSGRVACNPCSASGWRTTIHSLRTRIRGRFSFDEDALPPALLAIVKKMGGGLGGEGHADIRINESTARLEALVGADGPETFSVPYEVRIPWGEIAFLLGSRPVTGTLCGFHPMLLDLPLFVEEAAAPGLALLQQAARGRGHVASHLHDAAKYRLVADAIRAVARRGPGGAVALLEEHYPVGLGRAGLLDLTRNVRGAFNRLGRIGRYIGFGVGAAVTLGLDVVFLNEVTLPPIPHVTKIVAINYVTPGLEVLIGAGIMMGIARWSETLAIHRALPRFNIRKARRVLPTVSLDAVLALLAGIACFVVASLLSPQGLPPLLRF